MRWNWIIKILENDRKRGGISSIWLKISKISPTPRFTFLALHYVHPTTKYFEIYHWNTRVQVHLDSMVRFIYFFVRSIFSLKKHVLSFAFVWEVHCPGDNSDVGIGQLSVFREGKLSVFFFEKLIELWAKNRVLEADFVCFR